MRSVQTHLLELVLQVKALDLQLLQCRARQLSLLSSSLQRRHRMLIVVLSKKTRHTQYSSKVQHSCVCKTALCAIQTTKPALVYVTCVSKEAKMHAFTYM